MINTPASVAVVQKLARETFEANCVTANDLGPNCRVVGIDVFERLAADLFDRLAFQQPGGEALVEHVTKALYDAAPHKAVSPALSEVTGLPVGGVISYEIAIASGFDVTGLRRHALAAIAAINPAPGAALRVAATLIGAYVGIGVSPDNFLTKEVAQLLQKAILGLAATPSQKQGEGL